MKEILRLSALVGWRSAADADLDIVCAGRVLGEVWRLHSVDGQIFSLLVVIDSLDRF